jgi:hypothetical protein
MLFLIPLTPLQIKWLKHQIKIIKKILSITNKNDRHDITEILLKVALNTIKKTNKQAYVW